MQDEEYCKKLHVGGQEWTLVFETMVNSCLDCQSVRNHHPKHHWNAEDGLRGFSNEYIHVDYAGPLLGSVMLILNGFR